MNNNYRLQLRHGNEGKIFSTRNDVISYINGQLQYGGVKLLPYEPILFFYGADDAKNAIIMVGLPEGKTQGGKTYFLVDTANLQEQINESGSDVDGLLEKIKEETTNRENEDKRLQEQINNEVETRENAVKGLEQLISDETKTREERDTELEGLIKFNAADIKSVIDACGLLYNEKLADGRVSYEPDSHDEVIRDAKSISEAIDKVSKFASALGQSLKISVEDTDTVDLTMEEDSKNGGNVIKAEVNIAGADGLSVRNFDNNIIGKTTDGLYASASIEPSTTNPNILIFKTSGYVDGVFKVDAYETEVPLVAYKGDNGKNTGVTVDVDADKNLISATLNLASDDTNLLKLEDGEYFVDGRAKNIKYNDTTVAQALTNQKNRIDEIEETVEFVKNMDVNGSETETSSVIVSKNTKGDFTVANNVKLGTDKSIIITNGGLTANVKASYSSGTSTLLIEVGNNSYKIDLSELAVSVLKSANYDSVTEEIVLTFIVGESEKTIRIPVGTLIHDIAVDDTDTIDLTLTSVLGGPNRISAELRVDKTHSDNILTVTSSGVYVSKTYITDAVKEESDVRKSTDDELKTAINGVSDVANKAKEDIAEEINRATKAEEKNATAIAQEIKDARAAEKTNSDAIVTNAAAIKSNETAIADETSRAQKSEQANTDAITAEVARAKEAETKNANDITFEVNRATTAEGALESKVNANIVNIATVTETANQNKADIANEITRAKGAEEANAAAIDAEKERALTAEKTNADAISAEATRAKGEEKSLSEKVDTNTTSITAVTAQSNSNKTAIEKEIERATAAENKLISDLSNEISRAENAEDGLRVSIAANTSSIDKLNDSVATLTNNLNVEVERATKTENANAKAVETETNRATEKEADLLEKIEKNATDITKISTSVGEIEMKKEGELSYALYVNGTKHGEFSIPQDQFLRNVTYDATAKKLIFVFNTASGDVTSEISIADLVDTYTNGEGLSLNGNVFSVDFTKVASVESVSNAVEVEKNRAKTAEDVIVQNVENNKTAISDETSRATNAEEKNATAIAQEIKDARAAEQANTKLINDETARAKIAETTNSEAIKLEANTARAAENGLSSSITAETNRAKAAEENNAKAVDGETARAKEVESELNTKIVANTNSIDIINTTLSKLSVNLDNEVARAKSAEALNASNISVVSDKVDTTKTELSIEINKKANSVDVYTKNEITEKLADYAKTADVTTLLSAKANSADVANVYATKEALQEVKDTYATVESVTSLETNLGNRIDTNTTAINNFGLTYNAATSTLTYTNKNGASSEYKLYSGTLVEEGYFDEKTNSIVLVVKNGETESKITIPVTELLSDVDARITANSDSIATVKTDMSKLAKDWGVVSSSTVELTKSTAGEKDSLTASVKVSSSNKQAIQASTSGLYVSNDLEDYTVVYGETGTISAQKAISTLLDSTKSIKNDVATNISNISSLSKDVETVKSDISMLKTDVATNQSSITSLTSRVKVVEDTVNSYNTRISGVEASITNLNTTINTLIDTVTSIQQTIKEITGDVGDLKTLTKDVSNLKTVTGSENYSSSKTMSERIDALEAEDVVINAQIENVEKNLIGSEDNPVEGSVWAELNSIVDAGTFN